MHIGKGTYRYCADHTTHTHIPVHNRQVAYRVYILALSAAHTQRHRVVIILVPEARYLCSENGCS